MAEAATTKPTAPCMPMVIDGCSGPCTHSEVAEGHEQGVWAEQHPSKWARQSQRWPLTWPRRAHAACTGLQAHLLFGGGAALAAQARPVPVASP